jgi:hypothetical protein
MKIKESKLIDLKPGTMCRTLGSNTKYDDRYRVGTKYDVNRITVKNMRTKEVFLFEGDLWVIVIPKRV